ncbi:MAG: sulfatase-like hydrolase/transferase [Candidatus Sumerlaeota bacterium]
MKKKKPNILLIHSDQHRYDCVGANGHKIVKTPNLDRLAAEGANFSHAFTPCPICSPARASLLTGTWSTTHRCIDIPNTETFRPAVPELPTMSAMLKEAGYLTGYVGKFHREVEGGPTDHGFDEYVWNAPYNEWREKQGIPPFERKRGGFGEIDEDCPADKSNLHWQADQILRLLDERVGKEDPFFVRWDPPQPHLPCCPPREFADLYPPEDIPPWPSWPDPLENKPRVQKRQKRIWGLEEWPWEKWQPVVSRYFAIITQLDYEIGRLVKCLEDRGVLDDTIIVYTTDHGDYCGGHGQIDKHFAMYDDITRVPLLIRWPEKVEPGVECDGFVTQEIDIARTLVESAGLKAPESFIGMNLVELAAGRETPREDIFSQYFGGETGAYSQRMIRDYRYKYVYNPTAFDELYDLQEDPGEIKNLIDEPEMRDELKRLRQRLWDWMGDIHDPLRRHWTEVDLIGGKNMAQRAGLD